MTKQFQFSDVFRPEDSMNPGVHVIRLYEESQARTEQIRFRLREMEAEFHELVDTRREALKRREYSKVSKLDSKISINRDLRIVLYDLYRYNL